MFTKTCQRVFAWAASLGARKRPSPQEWVDSMPPELEAVVFHGDRALFLRSPEAPTVSLEMLHTLYRPENEDLFEQLTQRFRERRMH